jgi:capsular exopolysaccharide synthesis family protein
MSEINQKGNEQNSNEENFDLMGFLLECLGKWKWFAISAVVCLVLGYFYVARIIPTYQVNASIYISEESSQVNNALGAGMTGGAEGFLSMRDFIDEADLEILKSQNHVRKIVDSLDLAYSYYNEGRFRLHTLYQDNPIVARLDTVSLNNLRSPIEVTVSSLGNNKYDINAKTVFSTRDGNQVDDEKTLKSVSLPATIEMSVGTLTLTQSTSIAPLNGEMKIFIRNPRSVAAAIASNLSIEYAEKSSSIIHVTLDTEDVDEGVDIINVLLDFYNQQLIDDKNRAAMQTEAFILERLVMISNELKDVEQRLLEYRQANNVTDLTAQAQLNLTQKSNTEQQLTEVMAEQQIISDIERIISNAGSYQTVPSVTSNQSLTQIIEAYNKKVAQYNRAQENSTDDNPLVKSMQEDLNRDKARILQNIATVKSSLQSKRNSIKGLENRNSGELASLPPIDKGMQEIFREQQVKVNIYTFLLQRREEIALQKTLATAPARLIDDPQGSAGPVAPRKMMIYLMALIIGLLIPAAYIYLRRLLFPNFKDREELKRMTSLPIIGEISTTDNEDAIVIGENVSTSIAELFRLLRNNIGFTKDGAKNKVILITSAIPGEGKTFIAMNLAMTYALANKKTVIIGMDIRRPVMAHRFGLDNTKGVTTFLSGQTDDISSVISVSNVNPNLYILPAGPIPPNPNELLMSDNMQRMIDQLRSEFDYIIIDSAPIGVISDSFLIMNHCDIELFVTRASYSTKRGLNVLHNAVVSHNLDKAYIVLNAVNMKSSSYTYRKYGKYGSYGHYGSYGYGNDEKSKKKHK